MIDIKENFRIIFEEDQSSDLRSIPAKVVLRNCFKRDKKYDKGLE